MKQVSLAYVPEAKVGDYAMVHVGFAISLVDEQEALRTFEYLRQMDELSRVGSGNRGNHEVRRRVSQRRDRPAVCRQYRAHRHPPVDASWKSAAARRMPSSNMGSTNFYQRR